nr:hypothetical protein [Ignavibacteria bacterium]
MKFLRFSAFYLKVFTLFTVLLLSEYTQTIAQTHPPVYMTLASHNEDNTAWTTFSYYNPKRDLLVQLANIVQSK